MFKVKFSLFLSWYLVLERVAVLTLVCDISANYESKQTPQQSDLKWVTLVVPSPADQPGPHASGHPEGAGEAQHGGRQPQRLQPLPDAPQWEG